MKPHPVVTALSCPSLICTHVISLLAFYQFQHYISSLSASDFLGCSYYHVTFYIIAVVLSLTSAFPVSTSPRHAPFLGPIVFSLGLGLK